DYASARQLILGAFRQIVGGGITDAVRQTLLAVPENGEVSEADLVRELKLSKSTVQYRVARAIRGGWLVNSEKRPGHPSRLSRCAPLPQDTPPLPAVEKLREVFEHPPNSNDCSNAPQTPVREGETATAFECSKDKETF